ncbi:tryptophan 7-halogenase [Streptomyces sp. AA0539]|uniref:tryptophan 7-halogenase n=1 Tax=Streptomyces sp. AA0539 TaxID=1210045 RepID=UPI0002F8D2B1|nr:tryptophan 7-halogenase [Streptomyces sp. AA0539]
MALSSTDEYDLVVIGGGPAGSSLATCVARDGHRVLLLEKERFPRYQIGESLLPATVRGICHFLGVSEDLARAGFVEKYGGYFKWGAGEKPWVLDFTKVPGMGEGVPAYQVERMKFDDILLRNAARTGAEVREECAVVQAIPGAERVRGVRYRDASGREHVVNARFVADASGNTSRFHREVSAERVYSDFFRNIALFGYFENGKRLEAPYSGNVLTAAFPSGWFWYIPLRENLTSVGAVVPQEMATRIQGDREKALYALIEECPTVYDLLRDARRVTEGVYGDIRVRKDYSYSGQRFAHRGMVLVGDAACFVDPVLSSGVHLAMYSALLAGRSINSALAGTVSEELAFEEFESRYRREYATFYEFLVSFYDRHVDEQSYFWKAKKLTNHPASELEAFTSLVSGLASRDKALLDSDDVWLPPQTTEPTPAGQFPDWDTDRHIRFDPHHPLFETRSWVPGGLPNQGPRPGGLVPSEDGLRWTSPVRGTTATQQGTQG